MPDSVADWLVTLRRGAPVLTGTDASAFLVEFDDGGIPERAVQDAAMPGEDGQRFGVDTIGGRTMSLTLGVRADSIDAGHSLAEQIVGAWLGDEVRSTPGAVTALRLQRPGRDPVRVYGRPRKGAAAYADAAHGWLPVVLEFAAADHRYYADTASDLAVSILTASPGGWAWPLEWPLTLSQPVPTVQVVENAGKLPTWAVVSFDGPVTRPAVELLDSSGGVLWRLALNATLAFDQSVTIDPRPWARTALRSDGANLAGAITPDSARMGELLVPPGSWAVRFTGTDETGTAVTRCEWRDAWPAL